MLCEQGHYCTDPVVKIDTAGGSTLQQVFDGGFPSQIKINTKAALYITVQRLRPTASRESQIKI